MAMLGKILVVVFTALSLAVLTWAFGVYTQRIKFTSANKDTPGIFEAHKTKAADLSGHAERAFTRWSGNLATVVTLEQQERYPRRGFYAVQLYLAYTGTVWDPAAQAFVPSATPVQVLVNAPNGYLDISRPTGRPPVLAREGGAPLKSVVEYDKLMGDLAKAIETSVKANTDAIQARVLLDNEIVGVREPKLIKGLRQLISEQKEIETQANDEDVYAADFVTNREAEFGLFKKRRDAMTARMGELDRDPERKIVPPKKPSDPNEPKKAGG